MKHDKFTSIFHIYIQVYTYINKYINMWDLVENLFIRRTAKICCAAY